MSGVEPFLIATLISGAGTAVAQAQSAQAAKGQANAQAETQRRALKRQEADQRNALRENSRRALEDKKRYIASIRAQQARSGMNFSGTALQVFGELEDSYDQRINDQQDQALNQIRQTQYNRQMVDFNHRANLADIRSSRNIGMMSTTFQTADRAAIPYIPTPTKKSTYASF